MSHLSEVSRLVNTSVEDMKSSLECAEANNDPYSTDVLKDSLEIVSRRGEVTKSKILSSFIRKYQKTKLVPNS